MWANFLGGGAPRVQLGCVAEMKLHVDLFHGHWTTVIGGPNDPCLYLLMP